MKLSPPVEDSAAIRPGRFRGAWRAAHEPVAGVSRPMRFIAYAVPLTVLPSALWRLPLLFDGTVPLGERAYVALLSVVSEALAFTAVGLVARWGEVVPRWVPGLGGRRIPPLAVVVPAASGAAALTLLWTVLTLATELMGTTIRGDELPSSFPGQAGGWEEAWFHICYIPLTLWGPLLAVLTVAYAVRRRRTRT